MPCPEFELRYPNGPVIARNLTEETVKQFMDRLQIAVRSVGDWMWYRLPSFQDGEWRIGVELGFARGGLQEISLFHDDPAVHGADWSDWSEVKEQARAEALRSWLQARGFPVGTYPWGNVWALYDAQSGFGGGGVRYRPSKS